MNVLEILREILSFWIRLVTNNLARTSDVHENFKEQLEKFYELMVQVIQTGDPAWVRSNLK